MKIIKVKWKGSFFEKNTYKQLKIYIYNKCLKIFIIILLISFFIIRILYIYNIKYIIIEVDISLSFYNGGGPVQLAKGLSQILPYKTKNCKFIPSRSISPINGKNKSDYFYLPVPRLGEGGFNEWNKINRSHSLLLGPCYVPIFWRAFPIQSSWREKNFRYILKTIKGYVVHSTRVRNYLSTRSNTTDLLYKFKILRPCTNIMPKYVKKFENRKIDILYYEKFADLNRRNQSSQLLALLNQTNLKIERMKYGHYAKQDMMELANNTKFIIYLSFYDTGAIGLKEIQNFGVFCFTLQEDFVINYSKNNEIFFSNEKTSFYIPELSDEINMNPAFVKIVTIIKKVANSYPNSQLIAKINQEANKCQKALDDLCNGIR